MRSALRRIESWGVSAQSGLSTMGLRRGALAISAARSSALSAGRTAAADLTPLAHRDTDKAPRQGCDSVGEAKRLRTQPRRRLEPPQGGSFVASLLHRRGFVDSDAWARDRLDRKSVVQAGWSLMPSNPPSPGAVARRLLPCANSQLYVGSALVAAAVVACGGRRRGGR
jgi:hypothetical protein